MTRGQGHLIGTKTAGIADVGRKTMLRKKTNGSARRFARTPAASAAATGVDRRTFLRGSGLAIGGLAAVAATGSTVAPATAQTAATRAVEIKKSVCTHCSVGCTVIAEVDNGVWTCLLYTSPSPRDGLLSRMPSSA